jgi:DNA-binding XRE family transcriptional regulator
MSGGPFPAAAPDLHAHGLAVIPLLNGNVPALRFERWRRKPGRDFLDKLATRYPDANIGVLCGLCGIVVIDVDDPALVEPMLLRFGRTPLAIRTPRRGVHLWYRSNGERCGTLRDREGLAVDIKGIGGMVVVPPSIRYGGKPYTFAWGSWSDLASLPRIKPGSLPSDEGCKNSTLSAEGCKNRTLSLRNVQEGARNRTLFRSLLREAGHCDSEADLLDIAETIVAQHFELHPKHPFLPSEIRKTVASVWQYEQQGRNWVGKEAHAVTSASELAILVRNPNALTLRLILQCAHGADPDPFAISPRAMADDEIIDGWTNPRRYARARDFLLEAGFLILVHRGGQGTRDPHTFRLASPSTAAPRQSTQPTNLVAPGASSLIRGGCPVILGASGAPFRDSSNRPVSWAAARVAAGMSQTQLAALASIDRGYLSAIERGRRNPSQRVREALEAALRGRARMRA